MSSFARHVNSVLINCFITLKMFLRKKFFFISAAFTIVIVLGVILAIQFLVFVFFACKGWDAVFG